MKCGIFITLIIVITIYDTHALMCEEENFFGITIYKSCPGPLNLKEDVFCCGSKEKRICCANPLGLNDEDFEKLAAKLPAILGTIVAIAISLVVLCIVCCCCCPFCLLHKRRSRGIVHNPAQASSQMQPVLSSQPQPGYVPVQTAPYPNQPYQPQQGYGPPSQGYGAPPQGYGAQIGFPPPSGAAPYPTAQPPYPTQSPPQNEQPPPYAEKQMPYNPNY